MTQIFTGTPVWVWPLFALLVFLGLRARRAREVPALLIYMLPLIGVMTLRSVAALPAAAWIWLVFALAYGLGVMGGHQLQKAWIIGRKGPRVHLAGESLTLAVMMLVFWANFAGGVLRAVAPGVYQASAFQIVFTVLLGLCGGSFAGRALCIWRKR